MIPSQKTSFKDKSYQKSKTRAGRRSKTSRDTQKHGQLRQYDSPTGMHHHHNVMNEKDEEIDEMLKYEFKNNDHEVIPKQGDAVVKKILSRHEGKALP